VYALLFIIISILRFKVNLKYKNIYIKYNNCNNTSSSRYCNSECDCW